MNALRIRALSLFATVALAAPVARAQSAAPSSTPPAPPPAPSAATTPGANFAGTWRLATPGAEGVVHGAIDRAIAGMGFIAEPIARGRLRDRTRAHAWVRIEPAGDELAITLEGRPTVRGAINGSPRQGTNPQGEPYTMTLRVEPARITQEFRLEQGGRRTVFTLTPEGALHMHVRVFSDRLPRPVEFTLTYQR